MSDLYINQFLGKIHRLEKKVDELEQQNQDLLEVIKFVVSPQCDEPLIFLQFWNEGDFEPIKNEWPEFKGYVGEVI